MCGRFTLSAKLTTVAERFGVRVPTAESAVWAQYDNNDPIQTVVVVNDDGTRQVTQMRWKLLNT